MQRNGNLLKGLFLLRLGLGILLMMSALNKIIVPEIALKIFADSYYLMLTNSLVMLVGACQLVLSLLFILGFYKTFTYSLGVVVQIIALIPAYHFIVSSTGDFQHEAAAIPILFAFIALFLLRDLDTLWTLGKKKSLFART